MGHPRSLEPAHFGGSSLQQMHQWVHSGPGANSMHAASDLWSQEQKYMQELASRVRDRMSKAKVVIESQSGDAMQNAVAPVVLWSEVTADNALTQSQRMQEQGEAFSKVQSAVPNPSELQSVPSDNWFQKTWASITGSKTDTQIAQQHNEQLRQEAVTAFNSYQGTSQSSVSGTPVFTAPPAATVDTSVNSSGGGPGVGSFSAPGGGGGGAGGGATGGGGYGSVSHGSSGSSSGVPVIPPVASQAVSPVSTHAESFTPTPTPPSFQSPSLGTGGASGASGGIGGGFSGVLGGFGGGGGAGGSSGGRLSGLGAGAESEEEQAGRAGANNAGRAALAAEEEEEAAAGRGSNSSSTSQSGMGGRGSGKKGEEDDEHYTPEFLKGDHGFFDDDMPRVAPPVFGE